MERIILILLVFIASCSNIEEADKGIVLARAFDNHLYVSDLEGVIPAGSDAGDSISMVRDFIDNWVRQQIVLRQAEKNLKSGQMDFEKQLEAYKNSLVIFEFESNLIKQNLDTTVTEDEIKQYYNENQSNFELRENILKVKYVKLLKDIESRSRIRRLMQSNDPDNIDELELYCADYAVNYFLDDETWLYFNDLLKEIPLKDYNQESYLRNNKFLEIESDNFIYLLMIVDYKMKEGISPLSLELENIRQIIINRRKISLIKNMRESLYNEAVRKGDFELFIPGA